MVSAASLSLIIFTKDPSALYVSYANEHHVALLVHVPPEPKPHQYHATEDLMQDDGMLFEHLLPSDSKPHTEHDIILPIQESGVVWEGVDRVLKTIPMRYGDREAQGWNCQHWVVEALEALEKEGLLGGNKGKAEMWGRKMWSEIERVADKREGEVKGSGQGLGNTYYYRNISLF